MVYVWVRRGAPKQYVKEPLDEGLLGYHTEMAWAARKTLVREWGDKT